jgi:hypothetical protein
MEIKGKIYFLIAGFILSSLYSTISHSIRRSAAKYGRKLNHCEELDELIPICSW